jgi:hypothetical protein
MKIRNVRRFLVTDRGFPSSPILVTLMMEALISSETSVPKEPHGLTSQKTPFFIATAVKTSNLTLIFMAVIVTVTKSLKSLKTNILYMYINSILITHENIASEHKDYLVTDVEKNNSCL